jgi:serine/threonine protein kinase
LGFIHKDLKPDNVLIDRDGHCVIADLGGCDIIPGISPTYAITRNTPGTITPEYAAPELYQWDTTKRITYTQAIDLWSLGVTLCALVTYSLPKSLKRPESPDEDDGYSLQALGLEPDNIRKTLGKEACPEAIIEVIVDVRPLYILHRYWHSYCLAVSYSSQNTIEHQRS